MGASYKFAAATCKKRWLIAKGIIQEGEKRNDRRLSSRKSGSTPIASWSSDHSTILGSTGPLLADGLVQRHEGLGDEYMGMLKQPNGV
jgi:hypothetical protein